MRPTRWPVLLVAIVVAAAAGYLLAATAYAQIPPLPGLAPATLAVLAVLEGALAYLVGSTTRRRRPGGRPMHPLQIARAAVLAKASSSGGAAVAGVYGGIFLWTFARRGDVATYSTDARIAGLSALAGLALIVAALALERGCRTPPEPPEAPPADPH